MAGFGGGFSSSAGNGGFGNIKPNPHPTGGWYSPLTPGSGGARTKPQAPQSSSAAATPSLMNLLQQGSGSALPMSGSAAPAASGSTSTPYNPMTDPNNPGYTPGYGPGGVPDQNKINQINQAYNNGYGTPSWGGSRPYGYGGTDPLQYGDPNAVDPLNRPGYAQNMNASPTAEFQGWNQNTPSTPMVPYSGSDGWGGFGPGIVAPLIPGFAPPTPNAGMGALTQGVGYNIPAWMTSPATTSRVNV